MFDLLNVNQINHQFSVNSRFCILSIVLRLVQFLVRASRTYRIYNKHTIYGSMTENFPLVVLAQHGLFVTNHSGSIADAESRPYSIRLARETDVTQLLLIEKMCWGKLELSHERILSRIRNHPTGQWVSMVGSTVVGVLYTQNLSSTDVLLQNGINFDNQEQLHITNNSCVVQLLGVAVLPDFAHMQIGSGLRDFVLQLAYFSKEISHVVAMTRCSSPLENSQMPLDKQIPEYNAKALSGADPTLSFHLSGGAEVVCTVPNYRPADTLNFGYAVYIKYTLRPAPNAEKKQLGAPASNNTVITSDMTNTLTTEDLRRLLVESLDHAETIQAVQALSSDSFLDASFMDMGLHSLAMVDLQTKLSRTLVTNDYAASKLHNSRTWLFDFPTPRALLTELNSVSSSHSEIHHVQPTPEGGVASTAESACSHAAQHFAIVGMSCRLPGGINSPEEFHTALLNRVDTVVPVPSDWGWDAKTKHASLLTEDTAESFDAAFFKLNAAEAQEMDPHQRIILEVAHEALVNAQILQQKSNRDRVGVFVGLCNSEWSTHRRTEDLGPYSTTGSAQSAAANRVSYLLGLTGPSMVVDTACSSSLAALHTAMNSLRCGDCDVALVAAADLLVSSHSLKIRESANMLSSDGVNRSFDEGANGYVRGEGAGAIVLKTLARAEADRKINCGSVAPILAVIRGSAMNQDGRSASFTAPNGSAQRALLREALRVSGVEASEVSYVEAHGTGTSLGDPIEWGAIRDVLLASPHPAAATAPLVIGALKSNIGHLEGAAGMAGLIKAINCVRARTIPANLHLQKLNTRMIIDPSHRHAHFPEEAVSLRGANKGSSEVIAGVSSFGSGGTNVHVILQSYTETAVDIPAATPDILNEPIKSTKLAFLCAGQGLVYRNMGRELFEAEPAFKDCITRCSLALSLQPSLLEVMYTSPDSASMIHTPVYSQLALFALEVALAYVWKTRGVSPDVLVGHSLGEYAAAVLAGVFTPEVGIQLVYLRLQSLIKFSSSGPATGMMAAVRCSESDAVRAIETVTAEVTDTDTAQSNAVALAGINGPNSVVVSGTEDAVKRVLGMLGNPSSKNLVVEYAFHSPLVLPAAQDFEKQFTAAIVDSRIRFSSPLPNVQFISCLHGKLINVEELTKPAYWVQQMLRPVRFLDCVRALRCDDVDARIIAEIGPSNMFVKLAALSVATDMVSSCKFTSSLEKGTDSLDQLNFAVSVVQRSLLTVSGTRGGRLSDAYRPVAMKWRQKGRCEPFRATCGPRANTRSSYNEQSYLYEIVRGALLSVLSPEAAEDMSGETSFLSLGVDSLAAQAVRNALATQLNLPALSNTVVLKHPSVDELVEFLYAKIHTPEVPAVHVARSIGEAEKQPNALAPEAVFDIDDLPEDGVEMQFPASCMQQAMLFHHVSDPEAKSFIETFRWEVSGEINLKHFHQAWISVITMHSSLRSSFDPFAVPVALQRVWNAPSIVELQTPLEKSSWFKFASLAKVDGDAEVQTAVMKELRAQRAAPFDLTAPLLPRVKVLSRTKDEHVLLLTIHHAVIDGFSVQILLQDLSRFYVAAMNGLHQSIVEAPSYHAFTDFERHLVSARDKSAQRFWSNTVQGWQSGPHALVNMPVLKVNLHDEDVVRVTSTMDAHYLHGLQSAARKANVTLAALFHAAWGATYAKLTCSEDILYGNTSSGRSANISEIREIVGPVINTFPMRYTVEAGQSVGDYLHTVQRSLVNALEFESFPLVEIQKLASGSGKLFSVIFDFQTTAWDHVLVEKCASCDGITMTKSRLLDRIGCPLSIRVIVDKDTLQLHATSECKEYGHAVLESVLNSLIHVTNFICEVFSGGGINPLHRDVRARVFDLMDLVPLCRNRKLSIVTFVEDEEDVVAAVHDAGVAAAAQATKTEEVDHVLPYISNISAPTQFLMQVDGEDRQNFLQNCALLGCDHTTVLLSFFFWAVRQYAQHNSVGLHFTSAHANNATKHIAVNVESNIPLKVLFMAVASALAVDQSTMSVKSKSAILFTCAPNPLLTADTAAALIFHESSASFAINLKFPSANVPSEVMSGINGHFQKFLGLFIQRGGPEAHLLLPCVVPAVGPVDGVRPDCVVSDRLMHEDVLRNASCVEHASSSAVVQLTSSGEKIAFTYAELQGVADFCASKLVAHIARAKAKNPESTCVIAVVMEKGWEQVAAVLAVHRLQCAYLPMDARLWPEQRIRQVLDLSEAVAVFTQDSLLHAESLGWLSSLAIPVVTIMKPPAVVNGSPIESFGELRSVSADALAYLIYTSGSTGIPKGVCCHHRGAMNTIDDLNSLFSVTAQDKLLALSSLSFDLSVYDIFGLLSAGGTVVIPSPNTISPPDPSEWFDIVESEGVSIWNTVPAFMELLVSHAEYLGLKLPACLRLVYLSGDWIPVSLPNRIRAVSACADIRIISMGGATEASIWSNMFELENVGSSGGVPEGWSSIPYGQPMRNQRMYVLNERMENCEAWVTGAIYIGGVGVAQGYYKNPERTEFQFVRHKVTGESLFRTGDLGRVRPGGLIEILGREDSQVKVNGFRIELGEIERVLMEHKDVASAALAVHNNTLCAYLVMRNVTDQDNFDPAPLRDLCQVRLAEYMVPKHFMCIDEIPLSANGKVMREKLPKVGDDVDLFEVNTSNVVLTDKEQIIADVWGTILGVNSAAIPMDANFFSLGGDSLRSVQVVALAKKFGLLISVPQIFNCPTVRSLAEVANSFRDLGPEILGTSSDQVNAKPIFTIEAREDLMYEEYPLIGINQAHFVGLHTSSYAKDGMTPQIYFEWEIGQPGMKPVMMAEGEEDPFAGQISVPKFEQAIDLFVARHATFRSIVCKNGNMRVLKHVPHFKIAHVHQWDGHFESAVQCAQQARTTMMDNGPTVHDWPLFEVRITHTSATSSLVHINVSLFLMDAMSDLILRQELSALYRAAPDTPISVTLPEPASLQFKDYCSALTTKLHLSDEYIRAREYWLSRIDDLSSGPELPMLPQPVDGRDGGALTGKFVNHHRWLTVLEWKRARKNCAFHSVTMPAVLLAAYSLVLYRWGSRDKFLINILQCLRHQVHEDVNKMVGNCSSTILCDIDLRKPEKGELTFRVAVQRVAQELSQNLEHAVMSGVEVMQELNRIRGKTFKAVAPFIFTTPIGVEKGNKQVSSRNWMFQEKFFSERVPHTACVNAIKADPNGTACASLDIVDGVFPEEVVEGMHHTYCQIIDLICAEDPNTWHEPLNKHILLPEPVPCIRPDCEISDRLMHDDFIATSHQLPGSTQSAVVHYSEAGEKVSHSYSDLLLISNATIAQLVSHIARAKAKNPESTCVIAVVMEKGWEQVAAVLAVHRLQCAYLPMDARLWPEQRIRQVLDLSEAVAVLTQDALLKADSFRWLSSLRIPVVAVDNRPEELSATDAATLLGIPKATADSLAYLIYTSGSTGIPKGVCCHHRGAMNTIDDLNSLFSVTAQDKVLALSSLSFDLSVYDIFGLLSAGGTVVIPSPNTVSPPDPSKWFDLVQLEKITIWNTVPAFMELLVSHAEYLGLKLPACLRLVYLSGDWIPVSLPNRIRAVSACADIRIISMGGATEASIWSNMFELENVGNSGGVPEGWSSIPYGQPMRNQRMYVLNERMENCEAWVTGAIYIGGVGVAQGYYKNPERTEFQFVRHKVTGESLFRTGDLGRVRPGGLIEILGREDSQVKVNGFRIELGEIERVLMEHKDVASAALAVHNNTLCAYLVMHSSFDKVADETAEDTVFELLQEACKVKLAEYMVPKHFMYIDEVPLSSNGKVMREKLPSPQQLLNEVRKRSNSITDRLVLPATDLESQVRAIFAQVLGSNADSICCKRSTFFDLGGNSLSSIQLIFGLRDKFGVTVGVQDLFRTPTVIGVAALIALDQNYHDLEEGASHALLNKEQNNGTSKGATIQQLQLNDGAVDTVPMILFNPAGASGLCYMQLVQQLNKRLPVYVLDDGVMTSGRDFLFESIEQVARTCMPLVQSIAQKHRRGHRMEIVLAGWSYGGVVASVVARMLSEQLAGHQEAITVNALILFDAPLRDPRASAVQTSSSVHTTSSVPKVIAPAVAQTADTSSAFDVQQRTEIHFSACTDLLRAFYLQDTETEANQISARPLKCVVVDVRPEQTDYDCGLEAAAALTSGEVRRAVVPGTHWTMLFLDNAHTVAKTIQEFL